LKAAARALAVLALLAVALRPELSRYSAERRLAVAGEAFRVLLSQPQSTDDPYGALDRVAELALSGARGLPGDPRPWVLAGSAHLTAGRPERALELYGTALDRSGERAEVDLNIGRARALLGQETESRGAFLRAGWISPALLATLPAEVANPVRAEVARLEEELRSGRLQAPPPPVSGVRR
jgi:cytochrome c-type biogenesis protein CcmH/NrfG